MSPCGYVRSVLFSGLIFSASNASAHPARASTWPDSIFDGAPPTVLSVVKANPDLVYEAEQHIYICFKSDEKQLCQLNQYRFVLDYVAAFYNDHNSQMNIEYDLSEQAAGFGDTASFSAPEPGILPNPIQACAWSLAILGSGGSGVEPNDSNEVDINCANLSEDAHDAAKARATVIDKQIQAQVAKGKNPSSVVDDD